MLRLSSLIFLLVFYVFGKVYSEGYGAYDLIWKKFEECPGPKPKCGKMEITNTQNMSDLIFKMDISKDCPLTQARVVIGSKNSTSTKKLWNYSMKLPCQHFVMGPIITKAFNMSRNSCKVNQGKYEIHQNLDDSCKKFLGPNFFYGTYTFKVFIFNKSNTFLCFQDEIKISEKHNDTAAPLG